MKYVIIGNGVAGITAANEIRSKDSKSEIIIISREYEHFFSRTALMYEFCGQLSRKDLEPYERNHYDKMNFQRISDEVLKIDPKNSKLELKSGNEISFDKLLIATGSIPVKAPFQKEELENVGHFVRIQDLEWLKEAAKKCKAGNNRAVVVGGGLIGIEAAEILLHAGIETHFLIRETWYWPIALNKNESTFISEHMRNHGLNVHLETEVSELVSEDNKLKTVKFTNGDSIDADLMVVSIGVTPSNHFLEDSGIELSEGFHKGIEVNDNLQSNYENIYSAGDCATVTWFNGWRRTEQLWYTARDQGLIAGKNMTGEKLVYKRGLLYNSAKFFDVEYTTAGLVNFDLENQSEWYQKLPDQYVSQRIVLQDDKVIGFNMLGSRWDHRIFLKWIEEGRSLDFVLSKLEKARFDAEFSSKFKITPDAQVYQL